MLANLMSLSRPANKSPSTLQVRVAATFTAEPVAELLSALLAKVGLAAEVQCAPYQQIFQQLTDPGSAFAGNRAGVNVLLVRPEDFVRFHAGSAEQKQMQMETLNREFSAALTAFSETSATPLICVLCPFSPVIGATPAAGTPAPGLGRQRTSSLLNPSNKLHVLTSSDLLGDAPLESIFDPHADAEAHIPYTAAFFTTLALALARHLHALKAAPRKVIALDCDETLWSGVCGEIGPDGVTLDAGRRALQEFVKARKDAGFLLCLCSKNAETDVRETFARHPAWPLQFADITAQRIDWQPKSTGLRALAAELGLGLDSVIFLDDNPLECAEVRAALPEVDVLELPRDPGQVPAFLAAAWIFDHLEVTAEDLRRTEFYAHNLERENVRASAASYADFLARLELEVKVAPLADPNFPRAAQLTQRTNQFNLTLRRQTAAELQTGQNLHGVTVRDRFGDYGLVGLLASHAAGGELIVDDFLLSCRVLGRGVEYRMLQHLVETARAQGCGRVALNFTPGPRNQPAEQFLRGIASEAAPNRFTVASTAEVQFPKRETSGSEAETVAPDSRTLRPSPLSRVSRSHPKPDWSELARLFADPAALRSALSAGQNSARPDLAHAFIAPGNELEHRLARIWQSVLHVAPIGARDNFFELGGQSLQFVEVHHRLLDLGYRDLAIAALFEHPTIAGLAAHLAQRHAPRPAVQSGRTRGAQQRLAFARRR